MSIVGTVRTVSCDTVGNVSTMGTVNTVGTVSTVHNKK